MLQALIRQSIAKEKRGPLFALRYLGLGKQQKQPSRNKFTEVSVLLKNIPTHSNPKINELVRQYLTEERNKTQRGEPGPELLPPAEGQASVINRVFTNNALALKRIDVIGCGE